MAQFFNFVINRYQGDIHALTGYVVEQPIDEYNRPPGRAAGELRIPPSDTEVDVLFRQWRASIPEARKYLSAARNYFAASLWRRLGLRINETVMLDIRDWRPDLGEFGKLQSGSARAAEAAAPSPGLSPRSTARTS
ncbi:hypothetical protein ACFWRV_17980 [Streptomyces sp. NPDC058576]|uniref:hypothetical protein n=1 Tax=Streptomyces sp. NPDC058576 TaxID=3346547 RepID=UPI00365E0D75